jgi:fumarate hydratase class II
LLTRGTLVFSRRCVKGIEANVEQCQSDLELSLALCTPLAPVIGYDRAAVIAKKALETNRTVREVAREMSGLPEARLNELLDPLRQTRSS